MPPSRATVQEVVSPRDRLLKAATELFYDEGVHVVGVDRLIERAGVAKASLYSSFGSKDGLVRAYLEHHLAARRERVADVVAAHPTPRARLLAVFADVELALQGTAFRGCRFVNATVEAGPGEAGGDVAAEYRTWLRAVFTDLARAAGAADPERLGRQLMLLYDGAGVAGRMDVDRVAAADAARAAAALLVDAELDSDRAGPHSRRR